MSAHKYVCSIDQGTSSTRCILFDDLGQVVTSSQKEHQQHYPAPGYVEHNVEEIWESTVSVITDAIAKSDLQAGDIAGVGITNQRETTVVWNK